MRRFKLSLTKDSLIAEGTNNRARLIVHIENEQHCGFNKKEILESVIEIQQKFEQLRAEVFNLTAQLNNMTALYENEREIKKQLQAELKEAHEMIEVHYQEGRKLREEEFLQLQAELTEANQRLELREKMFSCVLTMFGKYMTEEDMTVTLRHLRMFRDALEGKDCTETTFTTEDTESTEEKR